jgi:hypothetical protein
VGSGCVTQAAHPPDGLTDTWIARCVVLTTVSRLGGEKLVSGGGVILLMDGIPLLTGPGLNRGRSGVGTAPMGAFR